MISVVIPVYNMDKYLERCVYSILNQTYADYEVLLIDDGSSDKSGEICDAFAAAYPQKIKVIRHKENKGLSGARNTGIDNAKGEFIIFPDPDDWVEPDYLEILAEMQQQYRTDIEICGFVSFKEKTPCDNPAKTAGKTDDNKATSVIVGSQHAIEKILMPQENFSGYAWNKLYHMNIIRNAGLRFRAEAKTGQDLLFCYMYLKLCSSAAFTQKKPYHYNRSSGIWSKQNVYSEKKISIIKDVYDQILKYEKDAPDQTVSDLVKNCVFRASMDAIYQYRCSGQDSPETMEYLNGKIESCKSPFLNCKYNSNLGRISGKIFMLNRPLYCFLRNIYHTVL